MRKILFIFLILLLLPAVAKALEGPTLAIISPAAGSVIYGPSVSVKFSVPDFNLVDYKTHPKAALNQGHLHLWLDQTEFTPTSAIKAIGDTYTFDHLKFGPHTLVVELVTNTHTSIIPKTTTTLNFTTVPLPARPNQTNLLYLSLLAFGLTTIALYFTNLHLSYLKKSKK